MTKSIDGIWFTNKEFEWKVNWRGRFLWTDTLIKNDWENCSVSLARSSDQKLRFVIHRSSTEPSDYMGEKPVTLRYMLGFEVNEEKPPSPPVKESFKPTEKPKGAGSSQTNTRLILEIDENHWFWEEPLKGVDLKDSRIFSLYNMLVGEIENRTLRANKYFETNLSDDTDRLIPVIYQPGVDAMRNFAREIHCVSSPTREGSKTEVSIIFNNERLRRFGALDRIYRGIRCYLYGRMKDIETFEILEEESASSFIFKGIYSGNQELNSDSTHGDPIGRKREVKYFFSNDKHPIVFVNTSNHAMAEHDTNTRLWKWEYVPWLENAPIQLGNKTRKQLDLQFK